MQRSTSMSCAQARKHIPYTHTSMSCAQARKHFFCARQDAHLVHENALAQPSMQHLRLLIAPKDLVNLRHASTCMLLPPALQSPPPQDPVNDPRTCDARGNFHKGTCVIREQTGAVLVCLHVCTCVCEHMPLCLAIFTLASALSLLGLSSKSWGTALRMSIDICISSYATCTSMHASM